MPPYFWTEQVTVKTTFWSVNFDWVPIKCFWIDSTTVHIMSYSVKIILIRSLEFWTEQATVNIILYTSYFPLVWLQDDYIWCQVVPIPFCILNFHLTMMIVDWFSFVILRFMRFWFFLVVEVDFIDFFLIDLTMKVNAIIFHLFWFFLQNDITN